MGNATENESAYRPTREPVFTGTGQIGIVVRDLDATLRRYVDDYGIGPWQIFEVTPENAPDLCHDGQPIKGSTRSAVAMVGNVMWEVSQPLDEHGIFARFLAEKGEGATTSPSPPPTSTTWSRSRSNVDTRCPSAARSPVSTSPTSRPTATSG